MPDLHFSVLGPLEVRRSEILLAVGSPQQQAMLLTLVLRAGRTATAADLLDALWGEEAPTAALTTIRTYAWRLRKVLELDRKAPNVLVSLGDGYRLILADDYVDAVHAQELAHQAEISRAAGDLQAAYTLLQQAVSLWRGEPLAGIPGPFAHRQRERHDELKRNLIEERIDVGLLLGRGQRDIPELNALIEDHALRERPYGLLMRAQYQAGRQAEALATYQTVRRLLIEELGVEPGADLEQLHRRILAGEQDSREPGADESPVRHSVTLVRSSTPQDPVAPAEFVRTSSHFLPPAQLPPEPADFTGRAHLSVTLISVLNVTGRRVLPVVVVAGMSGVGKSALALHVAHRVRDAYPDGQLYAELRAGEGNPARSDEILAGFLAALGVRPEALPESLEAKAGLFRTLVDRRRILIVLDDAKDAEQVRPLLPGTADCGVLLTSRFRMVGLPAAVQTDLDVFYPSEALELLGRSIGHERVLAERDQAHELVDSCGLLPLAVRIVAARLAARPGWPIDSLARRLADERRRINELKAGDLTIAAAFEVGYRQLTEDQAYALRMAASVDGPAISLTSAAVLLGTDGPEAEELLESLVDAAMLESPSMGRYRYHSLVRAFARQKAGAEQRKALSRLLDFLLATAEAAFQHAVPGDLILGAIGPSHSPGLGFSTLSEARAWARTESESALALAGQTAALVAGGETGCDPSEDVRDLRLSIDLLIALSPFRPDSLAGEFAVIKKLIQAAVRCGDLRSESRAHFLYGNIALAATRLDEAEPEARLAVEQCRRTDDTVILRQALNDLGLVTQSLGRFQEAITHYEEAIELARRLGHRSGEIATTVNSALAHVYDGQALKAVHICRSVLDGRGTFEDTEGGAYTHYVLGLASHELERFEDAASSYEACLELCVSAGLRSRECQTRFRFAATLRALGQPERAVAEATLALMLSQESGHLRNEAHALLALGAAELDLGHLRAAGKHVRRAHELFGQLGLPDADRAEHMLLLVHDVADPAVTEPHPVTRTTLVSQDGRSLRSDRSPA